MLAHERPVVEVAVDSIESAEVAAQLGASRLELCSRLDQDGLTPDLALLELVKRRIGIPVFVMIRPRAGDFTYTKSEAAEMLAQAARLRAGGADGFVTGALTETGAIEWGTLDGVIGVAAGRPVTLHRAFDRLADPVGALEPLAARGVTRVLTSGGGLTAFLGRTAIASSVRAAPPSMSILAGGGIDAAHVVSLLRETGVSEIHLAGVRRTPPYEPDRGRLERLFAALAT